MNKDYTFNELARGGLKPSVAKALFRLNAENPGAVVGRAIIESLSETDRKLFEAWASQRDSSVNESLKGALESLREAGQAFAARLEAARKEMILVNIPFVRRADVGEVPQVSDQVTKYLGSVLEQLPERHAAAKIIDGDLERCSLLRADCEGKEGWDSERALWEAYGQISKLLLETIREAVRILETSSAKSANRPAPGDVDAAGH
jgi:hypothetical protein